MSEQKHTKEPWAFFRIDQDETSWLACEIWQAKNEDGFFGEAVATHVCNDDDARRIVACVNACAGIPIEILEQKQSGGLPWSFASTLELIMQRDELLAALKEAVITYNQTNSLMLSEVGMGVIDMNVISRATALVAKTEAEK